MKNPIPLAKAEKAAAQIIAALKPFCAQIEIAGSIRRRKQIVGDIDIVALPIDGQQQKLRDRITEGKEVIQNGPQNVYVRLTNGMELNVFIAHPEAKDFFTSTPTNWGSLLICRTGPREFNIGLVEHAKTQPNGLAWNPYHGVYCEGKWIASATEEQIFAALNLEFIPPQDRSAAATAGWFPFRAFKKSA
jgi:DNA polymerase (family 10)